MEEMETYCGRNNIPAKEKCLLIHTLRELEKRHFTLEEARQFCIDLDILERKFGEDISRRQVFIFPTDTDRETAKGVDDKI